MVSVDDDESKENLGNLVLSVAHEQSMLEPCSSRAYSSGSGIRSLLGSSTLEHHRVIPREAPRDFHVIWLTAVVKQSPIHWFGGLWRTTNELRMGVLGNG